jgi:hypothetical protein
MGFRENLTMESVLIAIAHSSLVFVHMFAMVLAAATMTLSGVAIFHRRTVNHALLMKSSKATLWSLLILWVSGLSAMLLDGAGPAAWFSGQPLLLAKLTVVAFLTVSSWVLHRYAFPTVGRPSRKIRRNTWRVAALGAFSSVSWGYALFLGAAKSGLLHMDFSGFMLLYGVASILAIGMALYWVQPILYVKSLPMVFEVVKRRRSKSSTSAPTDRHNPSTTPALRVVGSI